MKADSVIYVKRILDLLLMLLNGGCKYGYQTKFFKSVMSQNPEYKEKDVTIMYK